jgi:L-ribulokinase
VNGRRTPYANQKLSARDSGINLGIDAPAIMRALLESTAFGRARSSEAFEVAASRSRKVMAIGGVARKSKLGMQILADCYEPRHPRHRGRPVLRDRAAVFAATAAGIYPYIFSAQKALSAGTDRIHKPDPARARSTTSSTKNSRDSKFY